MDHIVQCIIGNNHTFVEVFSESCVDPPAHMGLNVDEGVLVTHTALYNKIHLKNYTLQSIYHAPKWSGLNQIVDIHRRICCIQLYH